MNNKIPVFYHIPKCGGTYVITKCREILRTYNNGVGVLLCNSKDETLVRIFLKNTDIRQAKPYNHVSISDMSDDILFIIIEPSGIPLRNKLLKNIEITHEFTILRHPFYRIQSLYNYIRSTESQHEPSHMSIQSTSFNDYVSDNNFESSWIIQNFGDNNYDKAIETLSNMYVYDITDIEKAILNCMLDCYKDININAFDHNNIVKNSCSTAKIKFTDISYSARKIFIKKTYHDLKIYKKILC